MSRNLCGAKTKDKSKFCAWPAGTGTSHPGEGRCYLHGGNNVKKGAAKMLELIAADPGLNTFAQVYLEDEDLLSARGELAALKARFRFIEMREDDSDVPIVMRLGDTISKMSQRIQEMEIGRRHYLHISVTANLVAAFAQVGQEFLPDPLMRERFAARVEDEVRRSIKGTSARQVAARALSPGTDLVLSAG